MITAVLLSSVLAAAQPQGPGLIDDFAGPIAWRAIPSDGVGATLTIDQGALRLDYDFARGMGFVVVRRELPLELPEHHKFTFRVRGEGPANNFEFKLVDATPEGSPGDNVWWVNTRAYRWPAEWTTITHRSRHIRFAWGPDGGKTPLRRVAAIEFAVAASGGGRGTVWIDDLAFHETAAPGDIGTVVVERSAGATAATEPPNLAGAVESVRPISWRPADAQRTGFVQWRGQRAIEIGGVAVEWTPGRHAADFDVQLSPDGTRWTTLHEARGFTGGRLWVRTPGAEAQGVRVVIPGDEAATDAPTETTPSTPPLELAALRTLGPAVGEDLNAWLTTIARASPRGAWPKYWLGESTAWTVVGVPSDSAEALLGEDGALEVVKEGWTIEPVLRLYASESDDRPARAVTWADARVSHDLTGSLAPRVRWEFDGPAGPMALTITASAMGQPGASWVSAEYELENRAQAAQRAELVIALRPMQAIPPWHTLNMTGGFGRLTRIESADLGAGTPLLVVGGTRGVVPIGAPTTFHAAAFGDGDLAARLVADPRSGTLPVPLAVGDTVEDHEGLASGLIRVEPWALAPGARASVRVAASLHDGVTAAVASRLARPADAVGWGAATSYASLSLPASASAIVETFRAQQAAILTNRDGPAFQPGSRTYERSWIRDGALTGTAMLVTGHADAVRDFLDWYAPFQYDTGKIPCVVDHRGPDPVPEHDSHGQYIYAVAKYVRFTGDTAFGEAHWPRVRRAVAYLESLIAERSTPEYRDAPERSLTRAKLGLVPESISHEGYSAKPMHSYWDGFFVIRGLADAAWLAGRLGDRDQADRIGQLAEAYRDAMYDSIVRSGEIHGTDYVAGCVELGDFDATSTAIGIWPCGELGRIPEPRLTRTFERYWEFFQGRRDGATPWRDMTPYEVRIISAMIRMSEADPIWKPRAHELCDWFLTLQRPAGWRQWGEIVWADRAAPKFIGDYPHTWVGGDFVNAVRTMFVDERERDGALVLGAGVRADWAADPAGVRVDRFPSAFGEISYSLRAEGDRATYEIRVAGGPGGGWREAPRAVVLVTPMDGRPIREVTGGTRVSDRHVSVDPASLAAGGPVTIVIGH